MPPGDTPTRILVLGGSGRIGSLMRSGWTHEDPALEFTFQTRDPATSTDIYWDVLHSPPARLQQAQPFDCMLVLSGIVPGPSADLALNTAIGTGSIEAAAHLGINHVLLASTSAVYGTHTDSALSESAATMPQNDYGRSKLTMEHRCLSRAEILGIGLCCLRIGNVAGADALLLNGAALCVGQKLRLDVFADNGTPVRSYIGPQTLARICCSLVRKRADLPPLLNVAAPRPVTMRALAEAADMPFELIPAAQSGHQHITLDCTALTRFYAFSPADSSPREMVRQWQAARRAR
jgi:nucleoside-diphosphate-sugar epimerase